MKKLLVLVLCIAACGDKKSPPDPPKPEATGPEPDDAVTIRVAADGSVAIMDVPAQPDDVEAALLAVSRELGEQSCAIEIDPAVAHAKTLEMIDHCIAAGVDRVSVNGVPVETPKPTSGDVDERTKYLVEIHDNGALFVAGKPATDAELDALLHELAQRPNTDVIVHPDEGLATGRVIDVWKRALAAGVPSIRIIHIEPRLDKPPMKRPVTEQ